MLLKYNTPNLEPTSNNFVDRLDFRTNTTPEVEFAINDPPEPDIDWEQVEQISQIELDCWQRLIGFYTCKAKRAAEIVEHSQFMQAERIQYE